MRTLSTAIISITLSLFIFGAAGVFAASNVKPKTIPCVPNLPCIQEETQSSGQSIRDYIIGTFGSRFMKIFLGLVGATSVVFIIVGGLQMHLALGNEETIKKARTTLTWAIAGLVIAILSVAIVQIISKISFDK